MKRESVTYRLATSGENDVIGTLAKIAESGEAGAKRTAKAWERDMRTVEAVLERANRSAERLKIIGGSETSRRIAESTGLAQSELGNTKSAEASMAVFIRQQDQLASARQRLMASVDPLAAAQQRYNATMAEAVRLDRQGALAAGDLTRIHAGAKAELDAYSTAQRNGTQMAGAYRAGIQQVGFQVSDFAVQVAGGTSAVRAFALQGPQAVQALALMGSGAENSKSKFGKFAGFLSGPWGAAATVAVSIGGALATQLLDTGEAADEAGSKTFDLSRDLDVLALNAKDSAAAMEQLNDRLQSMIELQGDFVRSTAALATRSVDALQERLKTSEAALGALEKRYSAIPMLNQLSGAEMQRMAALRKQIAADREALEKAIGAAANASIAIAQRNAIEAADPDRARLNRLLEELGELETRRRRSAEAERRDPLTAATQGWFLGQKAYEAEVARINALIKKAEELKAAAKREGGSANRAASVGDMTALLRQVLPGIRITSTTGGKHTKGSDHYAGRAIDFVVPGMMTAAGTRQVYDLLRAAGIDIRRNARGTEQFFGPGRGANRPGDHDDHFHLAWDGKAPDAYKARMAAEKALQEQIERNTRSVRELIEAGDPYAAIALRLKDELGEIDRLAAEGPGKGGLGSEEADIRRQQARDRATFARGEMFNRQNPGYLDAIEEADRRYAEEQRALRAMAEDQRHLNAQLAIEERYLGRSGAERDRQLALLDFITRLEEQGVALTGEQAQELIRGNAALYDRAEALREAQAVMDEQRRIGEDIVDTLFDTRNWDDWGDMGMRIIRMLIQEMLTLAAINPIKNALFGSGLPTLGSGGIGGFLGGLFGGGGGGDALSALFAGSPSDWIAGFASGTEYAPGGWARVGEFGEELVKLPRGAKVLNTGRTRAMERASAGAAPGIGSITINAPGADAAGLRRVEDALRELNASLERRAVTATLRAHQDTHGMMWQG